MRDHGEKRPVTVANSYSPARRDVPICPPGPANTHPDWSPSRFDSWRARKVLRVYEVMLYVGRGTDHVADIETACEVAQDM